MFNTNIKYIIQLITKHVEERCKYYPFLLIKEDIQKCMKSKLPQVQIYNLLQKSISNIDHNKNILIDGDINTNIIDTIKQISMLFINKYNFININTKKNIDLYHKNILINNKQFSNKTLQIYDIDSYDGKNKNINYILNISCINTNLYDTILKYTGKNVLVNISMFDYIVNDVDKYIYILTCGLLIGRVVSVTYNNNINITSSIISNKVYTHNVLDIVKSELEKDKYYIKISNMPIVSSILNKMNILPEIDKQYNKDDMLSIIKKTIAVIDSISNNDADYIFNISTIKKKKISYATGIKYKDIDNVMLLFHNMFKNYI